MGKRKGFPSDWFKKESGQWNRKNLSHFNSVNTAYRDKYFDCPECKSSLHPMAKEYRYKCSGCGLIFGWGWNSLYQRTGFYDD